MKIPWATIKIFALEATVCLAVAFILSCASVPQQTTPKGPLYTYRAEMQITLGTAAFDGIGVTKLGTVDIGLQPTVSMDRVQVTSCSRQNVCESGGVCDPEFSITKDWWTGVTQTATYHYVPNEAESKGVCPLYIEVYSKSDLTDWGMVFFRTDETLPAKLNCNGVDWSFAGLSACQTKAGLDQVIQFSAPIKAFESEPGCHMTQDSADPTKFWARPDPGFCHAVFSDGTNEHRMVILGFQQILVRGQ